MLRLVQIDSKECINPDEENKIFYIKQLDCFLDYKKNKNIHTIHVDKLAILFFESLFKSLIQLLNQDIDKIKILHYNCCDIDEILLVKWEYQE